MISDICVHLDGSAEDAARIAASAQVARIFDAFVAGIHINPLPEIPAALGYEVAAVEIEALHNAAREAGEKVAKGLRTSLDALGLRTELRSHDIFETGVRELLVQETRLFDLCVATRPYGEGGQNPGLVEAVMFGSGRATLLVPPGGVASFDAASILVAWRNSRESARALSEAMPFLKRSRSASICMVGNDDMGGIERAAQGSDIARHLDRHGIKVEINPVPHGKGVAASLLEEASLAGAGLLVMGAYGHSRLRQWALGGVTRDILSQARIPVLVAH